MAHDPMAAMGPCPNLFLKIFFFPIEIVVGLMSWVKGIKGVVKEGDPLPHPFLFSHIKHRRAPLSVGAASMPFAFLFLMAHLFYYCVSLGE